MITEEDLVYVLTIFRDVTGHFQEDFTYNTYELISSSYKYRIKKNSIIDLNGFKEHLIEVRHKSNLGYKDGNTHYWSVQIPHKFIKDDSVLEEYAKVFSKYFEVSKIIPSSS